MATRFVSTLVAATLAWSAAAASADDPGVEFFEKRIRPLFAENCNSCHSAAAKKIKGDLRLDSRAAILKGGESGPALVPGKPGESLILKAVRYDKDIRMPPKGKLSDAQIADLETWIKMGAPDPRDDVPVVHAKKPSIDIAAGKKFWAFQPVKAVAIPWNKSLNASASPIDRFVLAKLEAKGLTPAKLADRRTLLRRATFDLTGLPPTPEEIATFEADQSPNAFDAVIERLLASPAYGERWGRHWLDVVRYSDTAGDNSDYPIPQMYRYRNWVIAAFNADMPYDRFVREQIAGDLMPAVSQQDRFEKIVATGYLANSRRHGSYADEKYPWHLTIEDTIDNFSKAFLGLTMGCARCHDHKFDPLTAEDYYGLYGFFSSTHYPWPGIELDKRQNGLTPLADPAEYDSAVKSRTSKLGELDKAIKTLEAEKAPKDKVQAARKERDALANKPLPYELAYAVAEGKNSPKLRIGRVGDAHVQFKGDPDYPGVAVPRRFPLVLGGQALPTSFKGSGRLELAHWLTDANNPLTARVMVNRIWQHHFGQGIVPTPNNFGKQGRPPRDPELLDFLARAFVESDWSIKQMHRLIMRSRVYQLASDDNEANAAIDPGNDHLWRFPRRRLDAESIRDSLLAVSGQLDRTPGGPHPFPAEHTWNFTQHNPFKADYPTKRRSVYLMTQRIQRQPFLALFDGPDTNASTATRDTSTTPLQALFLMNDPFVHEQARGFASRVLAERGNDADRFERAFLYAFGRPPSEGERQEMRSFLEAIEHRLRTANLAPKDVSRRAWESLVRVMFMNSEFVYVN
jgi:mono/diheme cytochrome c family protein